MRPLPLALAFFVAMACPAQQESEQPWFSAPTGQAQHAQDPAPGRSLTPTEKKAAERANKEAQKRKEKEERAKLKAYRAELKQRNRAAQWRIDNPDPTPLSPAYPGSLSPGFQILARQAAAGIDNAFNTITASRLEFSLAYQNAMLLVSAMRGAAVSPGEQQVAQAIASYAEAAPICQQAAWDAAGNLLILAFANTYPRCINAARFRRAVADLTMKQNL